MSETQAPATTLPNLAAQVTTLAGQYGTLSSALLGVLSNTSTALASLGSTASGAVSNIVQASATALGLVRGGGTGNVSVNADGSLTAPPGFTGDVTTGTLLRTNATKPMPLNDTLGMSIYDFATFDPQGRGSNIFGVAPAGYNDDATAAAVFTAILADLVKCKQPFFHAKIIMRPGHYFKTKNWNWMVPLAAAYNCIGLPGSVMNCARLNLTIDADNVTINDSSTDGVGGILVGGYDVLSQQRIKGKIYYRPLAQMQYAIRRDAANGTDYNAFAASGGGGTNNVTGATIPPCQSVGNGVACQFQIDDLEVQDAAYNITATCGLMVGGAVNSFINRVSHYAVPNLRADGTSVCEINSAGIVIFGFSIYASIQNNLCQYKESAAALWGYVESLQGTNFGGSNCDHCVYTNRAKYDWRSNYKNAGSNTPNGTGLSWVFDSFSQLDSFKSTFDIIGVTYLYINGGVYWMHGTGGSTDGTYTGDTTSTAVLKLQGCSEVYVANTKFQGPVATPNGSPAIWWTSWTPTSAELALPNAPVAGTYSSQHLTVYSSTFLGFGENPAAPPIKVDAGTDLVRIFSSQWGSSTHDGLTVGMRLATPGSSQVAYSGNMTAYSTGMNVTTNGTTTFVQGNSSSGMPAGLGLCEDSASSYHCLGTGVNLPSIASGAGALVAFNAVVDPVGMIPGSSAATNPGNIVIPRAGTYQFSINAASTNATAGDLVNITYFSHTTGNGPAFWAPAGGANFNAAPTFTKQCVAGELIQGELGAGAHAIALSQFDMTVRMIDLPK